VDTRKTRLKAGFAAKTDRLDARRLADALRRESVVSIYIPPPAVRALLLRHAVSDPPMPQLTSARGLAWLEQVALTGAAGDTLQQYRRLLVAVDQECRAGHERVVTAAAADPVTVALMTLTGVGPVLSLMVRAEIGAIDRCAQRRLLASDAGLVADVHASARVRYGSITRAGSPWLRRAPVEVAVHAIKRPDALSRWARRLAVRKGVNKARVALARRLCHEIVRVWPRLG
jgi:transposase